MTQLAPILLFVYNRPDTTIKTVEALKKNKLADSSDLFVYSDGPRNEASQQNVALVRNYINNISGFKTVNLIE